jgi:phosphomannomutase
MARDKYAEALVIDIDGTLTPPREHLRKEMADALSNLRIPFFVAAGSDLPLLKNQFFDPLKKFKFQGRIEAFLNNGASEYRCDYSKGYTISLIKKFDIREHLGSSHYSALIMVLKETLEKKEYKLHKPIKIIGKQIIDRGSMINFAPIGRPARAKLTGADHENREEFKKFDQMKHYRKNMIKYLKSKLADIIKEKNLKILYGGKTSFDILIKGMDKTHPINVLLKRGFKRIIFMGDALFEGGNDSPIIDFIREWNGARPCPVIAIKVDGWQDTRDQFYANGWLDTKR